MSACLAENTLADFIGGRLDGDGAAEVEEHVDVCSSCFRMLAQAARTIDGAHVDGLASDVPLQIEEYRLLRPIGRGAMGQVFLAIDTKLDRRVAIKLLAFETRAAARERMLVEARAVARLSHPNVVTIHRVGELGEHPYIVCEYVRGRSLDQLAKPVPWRQVRELARGLARGLAAAHAAGVLHRDIKPANAMLGDDGSVKLLDFGLAKLVEEEARPGAIERDDHGPPAPCLALTATGALLGTPLYMAPEAWLGVAPTPSMDVYSLGAVVHELCTGVRAHEGDSLEDLRRAAQTRSVTSLATLVPDIDPSFAAAIDRCLARAPAQRFASAAELAAALEPAPPADSPVRPRARPVLAAAGLALAAIVITIIATGKRSAPAAVRVSATRPRVCSVERWCWDPATPARLYGVWRHARDDAWAVGELGAVLHWDGHAWTRFASDSIASLRGVSGTAGDDVWAAGQWGTLLHWDGSTWRHVESNTSNTFSDVLALARDDAWAITSEGALMHWDGKTWTRSPCDNSAGLMRIAGSGPGNVWAGGSDGNVLHWDGHRWQNVDTGAGGAFITGIAVLDEHEVWITGLHGVVRRGVDGHWSDVELPISAEDREGRAWFNGIQANARDDIWLLSKRDPLLHWDGQRWTGYSPGTTFELYGIGGVPDDLWAVGRSDLIVHWDGRRWQGPEPAPPWPEYRGVWASADDDVWIVGLELVPPPQGMQLAPDGIFGRDDSRHRPRGLIVHDDGTLRRRIEVEGVRELTAAWGSSKDDVWVVGVDGAVVHVSGGVARRVESGTHANLRSIHGTGPDDIWAVGAGGTILHGDGTSWRPVASVTSVVLNGVWAHGREAWAVGEHGVALHWDGGAWSAISTGEDATLSGVWGAASDDVWAVGERGTLLHWDGHVFTPRFSGTKLFLAGISGSSARDVWSFGQQDGLFLHWDGDHWNPLDRSPRSSLFAIFSLSPTRAWAVGGDAAILDFEPIRP
jgi:hypothetical protein